MASISLGLLLTRMSRTPWLWLAAPFLLFGCEAYLGFRLELLGLQRSSPGWRWWSSDRPRWRTAGYALLFATPTIAPTFLAYAGGAVALLASRRQAIAGELVRAATGLAVATAMLLLAVRGDLLGLIATMHKYQSVRMGWTEGRTS